MKALLLRWKIYRISQAARRLVEARGVKCNVWWFGAYYIDPKHLVFVLAVPEDLERDTLRSDAPLISALRRLLVDFSWPERARTDVSFDIESNETVQRESNGHWWHHYK